MPKEFEPFALMGDNPVAGTVCSLCKLVLQPGDITCLILIGAHAIETAKLKAGQDGKAMAVGVHARCIKKTITERKQQT